MTVFSCEYIPHPLVNYNDLNLEENSKLKVSINFQFLFSEEELITPSHSKLQKHQDERSNVQKCIGGEGREGGRD